MLNFGPLAAEIGPV